MKITASPPSADLFFLDTPSFTPLLSRYSSASSPDDLPSLVLVRVAAPSKDVSKLLLKSQSSFFFVPQTMKSPSFTLLLAAEHKDDTMTDAFINFQKLDNLTEKVEVHHCSLGRVSIDPVEFYNDRLNLFVYVRYNTTSI
jgi:hypothetical protein